MLRTVMLVILNFSLPWLLYLGWRLLRQILRRELPGLFTHPWPWRMLLLTGLACLAGSLLILRWHESPAAADPWHQANPAQDWSASR